MQMSSMKVQYEGPLHVKRTRQTIKDTWRRINIAKQKEGLTSFLMLSVLEAKIFSHTPLGAIVKLTAANWLFYFSNQYSLALYVM